jgi:hypothetical protein
MLTCVVPGKSSRPRSSTMLRSFYLIASSGITITTL